MIRFSCPSCEAVLEAPDSKGGGVMTCPECEQKMQVPDAPPVKSSANKGKKRAEDDDVEDAVETVEEAPGKKKSTAVTSAPPKKKASVRSSDNDDDDDEDNDEEDRPKKKKKFKEKDKEGSGSKATLMILLLVLVVLVLVGGAWALYEFVINPDNKPVAAASSKKSSSLPTSSSSSTTSSPSSSSSSTGSSGSDSGSSKGSESDPLIPRGGTERSSEAIYQRLLKSTAIIFVTLADGAASGSGFVIDRKNRLLITNNHVVADAKKVVVFFPEYDKGQLINEKAYYRKKFEAGNAPVSKVLATDPKRDLALVQVPQVPDGVIGLRPASKEPATGAKLHSVGSPGASGGTFNLSEGTVRTAIYVKKWVTGTKATFHEARVIETSSTTNPGDSGGPLADDNADVVGVTQGASAEANLVSLFIAFSEVNAFINETLPKLNPPVVWEKETEGALEPVGTGVFTVASLEGLKRVLKEPNAQRRAEAARAIGTIAAKEVRSAIPNLLDAVKDEDANVSRAAQDSLIKIGAAGEVELPDLIAKYLIDTDPRVKSYTCRAIAKMGPDGSRASDALLELTKDSSPDVRRDAMLALGKVGAPEREKVFPVLFGQLKEAKDQQSRSLLTEALASLGTLTANETNLLKDNLTNPSADVRVYCAKSLGQLGPLAKGAVASLKDNLKHEDKATAVASAEALGKIGPDAKEAKPGLIEALQDGHPALSKAAGDALVLIKDVAKADLPTLTPGLKSAQAHVKVNTLVVLASMGQDATGAIGAIGDLVKDGDKAVRIQATKALEAFAPGSVQALPRLVDAAKDPEVEVRISAIRGLGKFGTAAKDANAVTVLDDIVTRALKDKNADVNLLTETVLALGAMRVSAKVADHITDLLEESNYASLVAPIATALGKIGYNALPNVERLLKSENPERRHYGSVALGDMAPELNAMLKNLPPQQAQQKRNQWMQTLDQLIQKEKDPGAKQSLEETKKKLAGGGV